MRKILLTLIVTIGCAWAGYSIAAGQVRRIRLLGELADATELLRVHMLEQLFPMASALSMSDSAAMRMSGTEMSEGKSSKEAWQAVMRHERRRGGVLDSLTREDCGALTRLFDGLGESGRSEQERHIAIALRELRRLEENARREYAGNVRLYTTLGMLTGLALAVGVL